MHLFNPLHTHTYKQSKFNRDMIECFNDRWNNTNAASNVKLPVINEILSANFFLSKLTTAIVLYVSFRKVLNIQYHCMLPASSLQLHLLHNVFHFYLKGCIHIAKILVISDLFEQLFQIWCKRKRIYQYEFMYGLLQSFGYIVYIILLCYCCTHGIFI